ncbi:MAG: hypothetical protein ACR2K5_02930 [Pseudolabrys sp.]
MNNLKNDSISEQSDAAATVLIAKVKRLMLVTIGATFVALAIVLAFIGYRVSNAGGSAPATPDVTAQLPKASRIVSTAMNGERIAVTVEGPGGTEIHLFEVPSLKPAGRLRFNPAP